MKRHHLKLQFTFLIASLWLLVSFTGCSSEPETAGTIMEGTINVDPELDSSGDYSGIELLSTEGEFEESIDTLFYALTDTSGHYRAEVDVQENSLYPVVLSRNGNRIGIINLVFARGDTIRFDAELPAVNETAVIQSRENDAYAQYERVQRSFNRVVNYVNSRGMSSDSLEAEILKWSDLYWDLYNKNPETLAGERSAATSVSILQDWDNETMLSRTDSLLARYDRLPGGLRSQLTQFYADRDSLERSLVFLDDLSERSTDLNIKLPIYRHKIELLFDSARTDQAQQLLQEFRETYSNSNTAMEWADRMRFDIEHLAPGNPIPEFELTDTEGQTVSSESLEGTPYMIEFTRLDSPLYLQQYDRVVAIHQIYRNFGLNIITVPVHTSETIFWAFFEERNMFWNVVEPESFSSEEFIETYNLQQLPTRFLVDNKGSISKRYTGTEFDRVVQGLQQILTQDPTDL